MPWLGVGRSHSYPVAWFRVGRCDRNGLLAMAWFGVGGRLCNRRSMARLRVGHRCGLAGAMGATLGCGGISGGLTRKGSHQVAETKDADEGELERSMHLER